MKYKSLTLEELIISFDRLTRFKQTEQRYFRVFSEILITSLTEPRLKKREIENLDYKILTNMVSDIVNYSLQNILKRNLSPNDGRINKIIAEYENKIYFNNEETQKLLNNTINYPELLSLIKDSASVNLKWLKSLSFNNNENFNREKFLLKYPLKKLILAEGITEEILLPAFADYSGYNFLAKGIHVIGAGGKNQVVKMYYKLADTVRLPIFILLDKDAEENRKQIEPKLRNIDKIHLLSCGEFEDLLPDSLILKTVNKHFENFLQITQNDIQKETSTVKFLEELFKTKGLHEFKKADFAKLIKENICRETDISEEITNIISEIDA